MCIRDRSKEIEGRHVQRDLYSAFLLMNAGTDLKKPDREACLATFKQFADAQDALIASMKKNGISMKQCFGF